MAALIQNSTQYIKIHVIPITFSDHDLICCVRRLNWEKYATKRLNVEITKIIVKNCSVVSSEIQTGRLY